MLTLRHLLYASLPPFSTQSVGLTTMLRLRLSAALPTISAGTSSATWARYGCRIATGDGVASHQPAGRRCAPPRLHAHRAPANVSIHRRGDDWRRLHHREIVLPVDWDFHGRRRVHRIGSAKRSCVVPLSTTNPLSTIRYGPVVVATVAVTRAPTLTSIMLPAGVVQTGVTSQLYVPPGTLPTSRECPEEFADAATSIPVTGIRVPSTR